MSLFSPLLYLSSSLKLLHATPPLSPTPTRFLSPLSFPFLSLSFLPISPSPSLFLSQPHVLTFSLSLLPFSLSLLPSHYLSQKQFEPLRESLAAAQTESVPSVMRGSKEEEGEEEQEEEEEGKSAAAAYRTKGKGQGKGDEGEREEEDDDEIDPAELREAAERQFAQYAITAGDEAFAQVSSHPPYYPPSYISSTLTLMHVMELFCGSFLLYFLFCQMRYISFFAPILFFTAFIIFSVYFQSFAIY